jgi:hypothetical protein
VTSSQLVGLAALVLIGAVGFWLMRPPKKAKLRGEYRGDEHVDSIGGVSAGPHSNPGD